MSMEKFLGEKSWSEFVSELAIAIVDEMERRQSDFIKINEAKRMFNCSGRFVGMMVSKARKMGIECQPLGKGTHVYSRKALKKILELKTSGEWKRLMMELEENEDK